MPYLYRREVPGTDRSTALTAEKLFLTCTEGKFLALIGVRR